VSATLTGKSGSSVTVDYATSNGTATAGSDYTGVSGTLTWTTGQTGDKTFAVTIADDALDENNETINLAIANAANATISGASATATITDNDASPTVAFTATSSNGSEATTPANRAQRKAAPSREAALPGGLSPRHIWQERFEDIRSFERYASWNGYVILKFFLNVSKEE